MRCKSLMILALFTIFASECRADDVKCMFMARRIIGLSGGIKHEDRPFANCRIYVFKLNGAGEYVEGAKPLTTDASGVASESFDSTQVYFLYFAGRELSPTERKEIKDTDGRMLLKFQAILPQPQGSPFEVAKVGQELKATVVFSLPLWIAYLQRLEDELVTNHPKITAPEILSKARQLFYEDDGFGSWGWLIDTNVDPVFRWDHDTGKITLISDKVSLDTCEQLSNKYERNGFQYVLVSTSGQKNRNWLERFDLVSLRDAKTVIQIGHVLTGFESQITPPEWGVRVWLKEGVAGSTWAGDLGQAGIEAERAAKAENRAPTQKEWDIACAQKASSYDMVGDIIGAGNAETFETAIKKKDAFLSHELAKLLYDPKLLANSALRFVEKYGLNLKDDPIKSETKVTITSYVTNFALFWAGKDVQRPFTLSPATKNRAVAHLERELRLLNSPFPELVPITPPLPDVDFDGLTQEEENVKYKTDPSLRDTDGDGLWDGWEAHQMVPVIGTKLDMADPLRLDIYVQVDFFKGAAPDEEKLGKLKAALDLVVKSFEKPRTGKYLDKGIRLHLEWQPDALPDVNPLEVKVPFGFIETAWAALRKKHFPVVKHLTHRHALLALKLNSGVGSADGQALVVDVTPLADPAIEPDRAARIVAARFMRELGRTLGLSAGGLIQQRDGVVQEERSFKPNHVSIMNEIWSEGVRREIPPMSGNFEWAFEYQDFDVKKELDDTALREPDGLGPMVATPESAGYFIINRGRMKNDLRYLPIHGGIDWNHDGDANDGPIYETLNGYWSNTIYWPTLREWSRLKYNSGRIGSAGLFHTEMQRLLPPT